MPELSDLVQKADWKLEKHVPVIEAPDTVKPGEWFDVKISVGKDVAHPNTTEHHITWINVFFLADGEKYPHMVGRFEFTAHGESMAGPNLGTVYTHHQVTATLKVLKGGVLYAVSMCNIHGLWQGSKAVAAA